jgi:hypothetical protein
LTVCASQSVCSSYRRVLWSIATLFSIILSYFSPAAVQVLLECCGIAGGLLWICCGAVIPKVRYIPQSSCKASVELLQSSCRSSTGALWILGLLWSCCRAVVPTGALKEFYGSTTGAVQELDSSFTGALQELYKSSTAALQGLYRSFTEVIQKLYRTSTGALQEL